jgi:hypothetical protein
MTLQFAVAEKPSWAILIPLPMAKYIARTCPKCRDYFGVVVNQAPKSNGEHPINGFCAACGYHLKGWRLIVGRKRTTTQVYHGRMPKVFS